MPEIRFRLHPEVDSGQIVETSTSAAKQQFPGAKIAGTVVR